MITRVKKQKSKPQFVNTRKGTEEDDDTAEYTVAHVPTQGSKYSFLRNINQQWK